VTNVLVLGGGFGGLAAATTLRSLLPSDATIRVVSRDAEFFMGFAKLWDLAGIRPLAGGTRPLSRLARRGIDVTIGSIATLDAADRRVSMEDGTTLAGDGMVVALGAGPLPAHAAMLGESRAAHDIYDAANMTAISAALDRIESGRVVLSILGGPFKCPPAPYEAALIVAERLAARGVRDDVEVVVTTPQPISLPAAGVDASAYVASHLGEAGIALLTNTKVTALSDAGGASGGTAALDGPGGTTDLAYDLFLGVPATAPPPVLAGSGLVADNGWIMPDRHTLATPAERVYAVGDCTAIPNAAGQLPKAGVFAAGEGTVAATNLAADLGYGEPTTFDGHGYCFLELPGRRVAFVEGDFYADPLDVTLTDADEEQFQRKVAYEAERLEEWLP
jgi:sulfide:quinone oxidoreductase